MTRVPLYLVALTTLCACADDPAPALVVGAAAYPPTEVAGLSPEQLATLADLTSLGLAVAEGRTGELVEPLARRTAERARLEVLPHALGARRMGLEEDDLRAAYAARPEWELRVRHVVRLVPQWASAQQRSAARRLAEEAERRARAGEDFAALAAELSEEPGAAERGGLLEPGREGSWVAPFWEAALALQPGQVSPVVETEYGFHVLKLDGRRPVPFAEADRAALLMRVVPPLEARAAMEEWAAAHPDVALDPAATLSAARGMGVPVPAGAVAEARREWAWAVERWAAALGFAPGMDAPRLRAAALQALGGTGQEARIAREELRAVRPLLRDLYAVSGAAVSPEAASSSEI